MYLLHERARTRIMPRLDKAIRRDKKREQKRKMVVSGRGLLDPIDWEDRLRRSRKKKRK